MDPWVSSASSIPTSSKKNRISIFRSQIPSLLINSEMSAESASQLGEVIFKTLYIYEDKGSKKAVDELIVKCLSEVVFMKTFAEALLQVMEKPLKVESEVGWYSRLMHWSGLLVCKSQFILLSSKNEFSRVAAAQALILQISSTQASSHERKSCRKAFVRSCLEAPNMFSLYMEELKGARISSREMIFVMLEFSSSRPSLIEQWKGAVTGAGPNVHVSTLVPALLSAMGDNDRADVQKLAKKAAETLVLVIDEQGIGSLTSQLSKGMAHNQASTRRSCAYLVGYLFNKSKLHLVDEAPKMISRLIILLSDSDSATVVAVWEALSKVVGSVPKQVLPSYIKSVRDAVSTSRHKQQRRKNKGGPIVIPGFCLPKGLQPLLPIYLEGLLRGGSAEVREQAAQGLGELIQVTSEKALEEFLFPITGSLIRILGDGFPSQVKNAILSSLTLMLTKSGMALEPFFRPLQASFIRCLHDKSMAVRSSAVLALGKLSALTTRVDTLISHLLIKLQASEGGGVFRRAVLFALKDVIKQAGESVGDPLKARVYDLFKVMLTSDDDGGICQDYCFVRNIAMSAASDMGDDSSEVKRMALFSLKSLAKTYPRIITLHVCIYGPELAECLKDGSKPVRLAAERCALHAFQLTKGIEIAKKYITGFDASRISQLLSESSDDDSDDDNEDDSASG